MRVKVADVDLMEIIKPPRLLDGPTLVLTTALAAPRRRVYEATDPSNIFALANLLNSYRAESRPFRCGHTCGYVTPGARHLLRELEPQMVCLFCLTCAVHDVLERDLYPEFTTDWDFGSDYRDHGAVARYYASLLELHHELNGRAGATLLAKFSDADRQLLIYFLWDQLTTLNTDEWLNEDGNLSLLQGANQAIRHLNRAKRMYDGRHGELAKELGLDLSHMF